MPRGRVGRGAIGADARPNWQERAPVCLVRRDSARGPGTI